MLITREFVYIDASHPKNRCRDNSGWIVKDKPHFDPVPIGQRTHVLVHDILEHHNEDGDGLEFEMMAFGATFFIRDRGEWISFAFQNGFDAMYSDMTYFLRLNDYKLIETDGEISPDLEGRYQRIIEHACKDNEFKDKLNLLHTSFKWISKGYDRAVKRWEGNSSHLVCRMWESMQKKLENTSTYEYEHEGATLTVTFNTVTLDYSIDFYKNPLQLEKKNYTANEILNYIDSLNFKSDLFKSSYSPGILPEIAKDMHVTNNIEYLDLYKKTFGKLPQTTFKIDSVKTRKTKSSVKFNIDFDAIKNSDFTYRL